MLALAAGAVGCASETVSKTIEDPAPTVLDTPSNTRPPSNTVYSLGETSPQVEPVETGASRLVETGFAQLDGRRVGLISHQNSMVDGVHLADHLDEADNVELVALFGPEHGARGDRDAGEYVEDSIDPNTGVPVFSLFGETREPTAAMLEGIDVLVYDLQDVGARYYTYISTMGLAMQAAAAANIEFVVLDRPNPLGGRVAGGILDAEVVSFVGQYPIPDTYGLTAGELALAIKANNWVDGIEALDLAIIEMTGWNASMRWVETGLDWIAPSPALTTPDAALVYPALIYLEATSLSYGRGTDRVFTSFGADWLDTATVAAELEGRMIPGLTFTAATAKPQMLPGMTVEPAFLGEQIPMVNIDVADREVVQPVEAGLHILDVILSQATSAGINIISRPDWLDQLSGSDRLRVEFEQRSSVDEIIARQRAEVASYSRNAEEHHLYPRSRD